MRAVEEQIKKLKIPYPQKLLLAVEIQEHLLHTPLAPEDAEIFSPDEISEFYEIHNNPLYKYLDHVDPRIRRALELITLGAPMVGFFIFLGKENFMFDFIKEGGAGMLPILLLGTVLILQELRLFFRTVILKDHSITNLNIDSTAVFIGGAGLITLGFGATALGIYLSANAATKEINLPILLFLTGLKESMGPIIVSSCFAALIFLFHFTTRRLLTVWKAPIPGL